MTFVLTFLASVHCRPCACSKSIISFQCRLQIRPELNRTLSNRMWPLHANCYNAIEPSCPQRPTDDCQWDTSVRGKTSLPRWSIYSYYSTSNSWKRNPSHDSGGERPRSDTFSVLCFLRIIEKRNKSTALTKC